MSRSVLHYVFIGVALIFIAAGPVLSEEKKDDKALEVEDDNEFSLPEDGPILFNAQIPGFVLHGDSEVTLFDGKTKKKLGTDTLHFHLNMGLKLLSAEKQSRAFRNKPFKAVKKDKTTYLLTVNTTDPQVGNLVIEVAVKSDTPDITGRITLTEPDKTKTIKLFTGKFVTKGEIGKKP